MSNNSFTVRVSFHAESEKSFGVLVDLNIGPNGEYSASRVEWFPKSICLLKKIEVDNTIIPQYYLTAPEWLLKNKNVKYKS